MTIYVAVIADVVGSRELPAAGRARLQKDLRHALLGLNGLWERELAARFAITLGDELQCLLKHPRAIWDVAHAIRRTVDTVDWVVACGRGALATAIPRGATAPELDGPCFHAARAAVEQGKARRQVLAFGGFENPALDALARYYSALYWSWTRRQRRAVTAWRWTVPARGRVRENASALSHLKRRVAWPLVEEGDRMFRSLLEDA